MKKSGLRGLPFDGIPDSIYAKIGFLNKQALSTISANITVWHRSTKVLINNGFCKWKVRILEVHWRKQGHTKSPRSSRNLL